MYAIRSYYVSNGGEVSAKVNNVVLQPGEDPASLASDIRIVNANTVRMNRATMTAETSGTGAGGSITFRNVGDVYLENGSSITTKSTAEFDILYGEGISRTGELLDLGLEHSYNFV